MHHGGLHLSETCHTGERAQIEVVTSLEIHDRIIARQDEHVVARAAGQFIGPRLAVDDILARIADDDIIEFITRRANRQAAGQEQVFHVGWQDIEPVGGDSIDAFSGVFCNLVL